MKAIFYDRKNKREVASDKIMRTRFVRYLATGDDEETVPSGRRMDPDSYECLTEEEFNKFVDRGFIPTENKDDWKNKWKPEYVAAYLHLSEELIADLCYKSEKCPEYNNWDLHTTLNDLVFLRLED